MEQQEVFDSMERLQKTLEALASRGLRLATAEELGRLALIQDELRELGMGYLSALLQTLVDSIKAGDRKASRDFLRLQSSLRVYERLLSREAAVSLLQSLTPSAQGAGECGADGAASESSIA